MNTRQSGGWIRRWGLVVMLVAGVPDGVRAQQFDAVVSGTQANGSTVSQTISANAATFADLVTQSLANPGSAAAAAEAAFNANRPWSYQIIGFGTNNRFTFGSDDASNTVVFRFPRLGIERQFTGANRSESYQQLLAFLRTLNVTDAAVSGPLAPSNPVAGNPGSVAEMMSRQSFNVGVGGSGGGGGQGSSIGGVGSVGSLAGLGAGFSSIRQGATTIRLLDIPLSWTIRSDVDPRRAWQISVPLAQADIDGVKVTYYGAGVGYTFPLNDRWSLTPSVHYGGTSASDLNVKANVINTSVTSAYTIPLQDDARFVIGNMLGYYRTSSYTTFGTGTDGAIANTVVKNGILYSRPASLRNMRFALEYSIVDTRLFGTESYNRGFTEFGIAVASRASESARDGIRLASSYLHSSTSKGVRLNVGYTF